MKSKTGLIRVLGAWLLIAASASANAASTDAGRALYSTHCVSCHGEALFPINWSATTIRSAINRNQGGMIILSGLTDSELSDISTFLASPTSNDSDRLFDWAETQFPTLLSPAAQSESLNGYYLRYYWATNIYVATLNGQLYFYDANHPANGVVSLGSVVDWLNQAGL